MSFVQGLQVGAGIREQRETRRTQAKQRNEELMMKGYSFDQDGNMSVRDNSMAQAEQLQAQEAAQLAKALQGKLSAMETDKAFEDYAITGDASYLQRALDNDPKLKQAWGERGVHMISNIDFTNDKDLLSRNGLTDTHYDTDEKKDTLRKNLYKTYDGKDWQIGMLNNAVAETGAARRLGPRRAQVMMDNHKQLVDMMHGPKVSPYTADGHKYEGLIKAAAEKYNIPANLIASQLHAESAGDTKAMSSKGAGGLMQIMPETAKDLGITDVFDPAQAIDGGAKYLRQMLDRYNGDTKLALAAYNAGPGNVDKYGGIPPFSETQNYVQKILGNLDVAEGYTGNKADDVINTILDHQRGIANAATGTTNENVDTAVQQTNRQLDQKDTELDIQQQQEYNKTQENIIKLATEKKSNTKKEIDEAAVETDELMNLYGGEDQFYQTDFSDPKEYRKAYKYVNSIERLTNTELSETAKKEITEMRDLFSLGDPISTALTKEQTGLIDKTLTDVQTYFKDNIKGQEAKAAYATFRNTMRHILYGSTLSAGEIQSFNEASATLGKQLGPVLATFKVSMEQMKARLNSTSDLMNPVSAHVRLGKDKEHINKVLSALDERLAMLSELENPKTKTASNRKSLDSIFAGTKE